MRNRRRRRRAIDEHRLVNAVAAVDNIVAAFALKRVIAKVARKLVGTITSGHEIIASITEEHTAFITAG